ncbi:putative enoyl-[acyl-carrier-protein] reductase (NADH) [Helianthus annuus]|uniref:Enoyl-[acyl-carrier-protein] reductase (NADH) n=1 Tax=Helianthus annuus TaxID=4232 RepID=A0A251TIU8_HELAN|nr:probable nitronate monooxygenase [Helianthus annuus]KAF5786683.1 putative enoyl-[acyl-carrier-protein] reductase (NADH) [Helianthus annuus]KAJ0514064.1 putative enoyl-[acyl-carrier-protein] reductase (NADH) [Helianthus annuus]KAJ0522105.1 putative enoyl-[acyl-carrier-protein] reductase (NADH) [Helianthus annuus]KAJ0530182.1 putative enoyl-[acyl-carrier-protein] reductase (NADH) [Helianthus annuus]KAJ0697053.1 putative enoyl-[acyl-carrier-protein] reductase (NADH) [Helianthus annuus]
MGWRGILGFEYGIIQAPLGPDISGPELVAAVANAGAIGILRAPDWECPDYLRELIRKTKALTDKPFGVGIVLAFPHKENLKCVLEEKVALLQLYWGQVTKDVVADAHRAGVKVVPQIGSIEEAKHAADAGVDAIIVQGHEAGGHVIGQEALTALVPRVVDLVGSKGIPVIAAGGIVDERGYVAALALGAQGVCLGTRFLATEESYAHPEYKKKLVEMSETEYTNVYGRARWPGAPQRVLKTPFFLEWRNLPNHENEANQPVIGRSTIHGMEKEIRRFAGTVPNKTTTGDIENMVMYAGEGVGLINEILPAAQVVKRLVEGAQTLIQQRLTSSV